MARYRGSVCKQCRREGVRLYLKGERCYSPKCAMENRAFAPGQHGQRGSFRREVSDYGQQLREKQKARRFYGILEKQFRRYYRLAERQRGQTGSNLVSILERRLDNVVYRLGFADSRAQARQLVLHGHFDLNGRKTNIPSALVKVGDVVAVREIRRRNGYFRDLVPVLEQRTIPEWLSLDPAAMSGSLTAVPTGQQVDVPFNAQLIVEYYSR